MITGNMDNPSFPMRINQFLAKKRGLTRRSADELIKKGQVFLNGRPAMLGDKVLEKDNVEFRYRGKEIPGNKKQK